MLKNKIMLASGAAMVLALSACGGNDAEETVGAEDTMATDEAVMDPAMTDGDAMGADGAMTGEAGAMGSAASGPGATAGGAAGSGAGASGGMSGDNMGTNVPGSEEDRVGSQPSGDANVPTPE